MPQNELEVILQGRDNLTGPIRQARREVGSFSSAARRFLGSVTRRVTRLATSFVSLRGVIVGLLGALTVRGIARTVSGVADFAENLGLLQKRIGVSTELLSVLEFGASKANVSFQTLTQAIQRTTRRFGDFARSGSGEAAEGLKILGQEFVQAVRSGATFEELLPAIADRFKELEDAGLAAAAGQKLFDSEGVSLLQFLKDGREGLERMIREAERFGLVVGERDVKAATDFKDALLNVIGAGRGLIRQLSTALLPAFETILRAVSEFIVRNRAAVLNFFADMIEGFARALPTIQRFGRQVLTVFEGIGRAISATAGLLEALGIVDTVDSQIADIDRLIAKERDVLFLIRQRQREGTDVVAERRAAAIRQRLREAGDLSDIGNEEEAISRLRELIKRRADMVEQSARLRVAQAQLQAGFEATTASVGRAEKEQAALNATQLAFPAIINPAMIAAFQRQNTAAGIVLDTVQRLRDAASNASTKDLGFDDFEGRLNKFLRAVRGEDVARNVEKTVFEQIGEGIENGLDDVRQSFSLTAATIRTDVVSAANALRTNTVDALEAIIDRTGDAADAFRALGRDISRILLNRAVSSLIGSALGAIGTGVNVSGAAVAGVGNFPSAGEIRGPEIPIPEGQTGGFVSRSGVAVIHKGEQIFSPQQVRAITETPRIQQSQPVVNVININATDAQSFQRLFDGAASQRQPQIASGVVQEITRNRQLARRIRFA